MINKKYIITGTTALYLLGYISFNPPYTSIELEYGTKKDNYSDKYQIYLQSKDTISIGTFQVNNKTLYRPERLYIELNKFALENTIKTQALKSLENSINPELVKKYYDLLKNKRRNLDKDSIEKFLEKHLMLGKEVFASRKFTPYRVLKEYLPGLLSQKTKHYWWLKGAQPLSYSLNINERHKSLVKKCLTISKTLF